MKNKRCFLLLLPFIFVLTLVSCHNNVDPLVRPDDYILDYWICDTVTRADLVEDNIYQESGNTIRYLDSKYNFDKDENEKKSFPNEYCFYQMRLKNEMYVVSFIYICDSSIEIYGISMKTDSDIVNKTFVELGFRFLDKYSGFDACYSKNCTEFRIYPHYISIEYLIN